MNAKKPATNVKISIKTSDDYDRTVDNDGLFTVIYGEEGSGKTHSLLNLPVSKTWVWGFDSGVKVLERMRLGHRLTKIKNRDENGVDGLMQLDALIDVVTSDDEDSDNYKMKQEMFPEGISFIVIDHVTEMFKFIVNAFADRRNHFIRSLKDAGDANAAMMRYLSEFRNLTDRGIHVIILALEDAYEVGAVQTADEQRPIKRTLPCFPVSKPTLSIQLVGMSDIVGRLIHDRVAGTRGIRLFGQTEHLFSMKTRFGEGKSDFPHEEWEPADVCRLILKALSVDPEKALPKIIADNDTERAKLRESKGARAESVVSMDKTGQTNSVFGSTNEAKKGAGKGNREEVKE